MPELPEVETVARQLSPILVGQTIAGVKIVDKKLSGCGAKKLVGARVTSVERWGKQVVLCCSLPQTPAAKSQTSAAKKRALFLAVHLRMTGRLLWQPSSAGEKNGITHIRASFKLDNGLLQFSDTRRFGTLKLSSKRSELEPLGVDPTASEFSPAQLAELLTGHRQDLKSWLLRQDKITGIGNIYACEALYAAKISPTRCCDKLSDKEIAALAKAIKKILLRAVENCGTTFSDFQDSSGHIGNYQQYLKVYARENKPCGRCKTAVVRETSKGRSTFFCPICQI